MAGVDPTVAPAIATIDLKSLPDGFDIDQVMRWYINQLALGFGADYQDFAPLSQGNLGTSTQSKVLHEKARGKGAGAFMQMVEYTFNFQGVIPQMVSFKYDEQDDSADKAASDLFDKESDAIKKNVESGALTPRAGTQILLDKGFISEEVFDLVLKEMELVAASTADDTAFDRRMAEAAVGDVTTDVVAQDDEDITNKEKHKRKKKKRKGSRYGSKDFSSFESLPAFGEETRIDAEEEYLRRIMSVFDETLDDFERRIGVKGFKAYMVGKKEAPEDVFLDGEFWGDFRQRAFDVGEPFARKTALDAATLNVNVGLNVNMDFVNEEVLNFSRGYTNTFVDQLERTSKKQLQNAITNWQETGLGNRGLPDLVDALKPTFGTARAELIATNEVTKLFDEGNNLAHKAAGILIEEWSTAEDGFVEEICVALNGKRFGVDEGPRPVTGTHIGCRCERLPVGNNGAVIS